ncbi:DNA-binding domain-containing protein [Crenothrix polyspora]|uniref:Uncharacterized protein n=1 Tax=Crenothrix polyspora TaxID=360316 RepID=A0A1R4HAY1_9GAMM|nr:putative DNA-binding domain-containing protein [Crenothrix polyspora]SJM93422.1 conserved hypothetical protein [Crenothrix polyspora]
MKNSSPKVDFKAKQQEFTAYIRNPSSNPIPLGLKKNRMLMYRELFFNNVEGFLVGNFPVIRRLLNDEQWLALAQDFFANHHSTTPYFVEIPEEFINYLQNERHNLEDLPFLLELAHYEWVEMAVSIAKTSIIANADDLTDILNKILQVSPLAWPLAYSFPVHKISPQFIPLTAPTQPSFLVVYRDKNDDVHFLEITPVTYRLLEIAQENNGATVEACLLQVAQESPTIAAEQIINTGLQILHELAKKNIVAITEQVCQVFNPDRFA